MAGSHFTRVREEGRRRGRVAPGICAKALLAAECTTRRLLFSPGAQGCDVRDVVYCSLYAYACVRVRLSTTDPLYPRPRARGAQARGLSSLESARDTRAPSLRLLVLSTEYVRSSMYQRYVNVYGK
jgi:hypothetical protein